MARTPYTDSILVTLGVNADRLRSLAETHGFDSPIGQCAGHIQSTVWAMHSAERAAADAMTNLTKQAETQVAAIAGNGNRFDPSWLATYTTRATEASATLNLGVTELTVFNRMLDLLVKQEEDRAEEAHQREIDMAEADPATLTPAEFARQWAEDDALTADATAQS